MPGPLTPVLGFVGPTYRSQIRTLDCERAVNLVPEAVQTGTGTNIGAFLLAPGLTRRLTLGTGPHRAAFAQDGRLWVVSGDGVYEVFDDDTSVLRGTVEDDGGAVTFSSNGEGGLQMLLTSAGKGYIYDLSTDTIAQITDPDFPTSVTMGVFFEGYFVVLEADSPRIHFSALEDGSTWSGVDVAQKSLTSDKLVAIAVDRRVLWLLGTKRSEPWYNNGDNLNPLSPIPNVILENGCGAAFSCTRTSDTLFWLAANERGARTFVAVKGYEVDNVSTAAVEYQWSQYERVDDARVWCYEEDTHSFVVVQFPTGNATWVWDAGTNLWHERGHWNAFEADYEAHLGLTHAYVFDRHYVGSRRDGKLYELTDTATSDDGDPKVWERIAPRIETGRLRAVHDVLELQALTGVGLISGQGSDPQVMLDWSEDNGETWSNEYWASLGKIGAGMTRVRWRQLGQSVGRNYRLRASDPVITGLVNLWVGLRVSRS